MRYAQKTATADRSGTRIRASISFVVLPGGEVGLVILTALMLAMAGLIVVLAIVRGDPLLPVLCLLAISLYNAYVFDYIRRRERQARDAGRDRFDVEVGGLAAIPPLLALLVIAFPLGAVDTYFALLRKIRPDRHSEHRSDTVHNPVDSAPISRKAE